MTLTIKRLSECPLQDAVMAYNRGYVGYFYNQTKTIDSFSKRFGLDEISPDYSIIAYFDNEPVGIVLGGIKEIGGKIVGWNGGTGVAKEFRSQGIGKELMSAMLNIYKENGVTMATLEALTKNESAIALYKSAGYEIQTKLKFFQWNEAFVESAFPVKNKYRCESVPLTELCNIEFYRHRTPWPTHCSNIHDGNAIIAFDNNKIVGYSLFKKIYHDHKLVSIGLFQLEFLPGRSDSIDIIHTLLRQSFSPVDAAFQRTTVNIPEENQLLLDVLVKHGFTEWEEQVWMLKEM